MEDNRNDWKDREMVTIKFGKGLVQKQFTSKAGKELVEVKIPNTDPEDKRPWQSFVVSPKMIHDNQYGKGVWMKLPEDGETKVSRSVKEGVDVNGDTIWGQETRMVPNTELKAMLESYKDKSRDSVLSDLDGKRTEAVNTARTPGDRPYSPRSSAR